MVDTDKKLWEFAKAVIDDEDRKNLEFSIQDDLGILENLKEATTEAQRLCINNRWFFVTPGKEGRKVVIRDLLSKIVTWAEIFTKVGDQVVQYDPGHAALPWAGVRFLLQIAVNDIKKFDFVVEGAEQIARKITRCRIFEKLYLDRPSMAAGDLRQALIELYASMITYLARAKRYFEQDTRVRIVKSGLLARGDFEELSMKINAAESEVERYAALVAMELQNSINHQMTTLSLDIQQNYTTLSDMLSKMDRPISRMSSQLDSIEDHLHELERKRILDWLSTQPYIEHHASINRRVLQGTGQWLLSHQTFRHWRTDSSNSLLWLHGMQGTGKSSLVSIAIREIGFSENLSPPPVYFYCSRNTAEPERSNATQALACIARQLSILRPGTSLLNPTLAAYEGAVHEPTATGSSVRKLSIEESCELIIELTGYWPMTTIVIDALDECDRDTRGDLIEALEKVLQESTSLVKVLISSREDEDLKYSLQNYPGIQVTSDGNQGDINTFVNTKTDELVAKNRLLARIKSRTSKDDLKSLIKADLIRGAQGMFRWAQLQLQRLQGARFEKDVRTALASMPRELSDLYDELYTRMVSTEYKTDRLIVTNVLRWMLCSTRRMTAKDFFTAISLNICVPVEDIDEAMILDLLPEFVLCDESEGNQRFRFAHPSVREFLVKRPGYSSSLSNAFAAEICLLAIIGTSKSPAARQFLHDRKLNLTDMGLSMVESYKDSIYDYSLRFWSLHSRLAGEHNRTTLEPLKKTFNYFLFNDSDQDNPLNCWVRSRQRKKMESAASLNIKNELSNHRSSGVRAFFLGCAFGFHEVVSRQIKSPDIDNDLKERGLLVAIHHRQNDILKLLLSSGNDFEISDGLLIALVTDSSSYDSEALEWLLERQNSINITGRVIVAANRSCAEVMTLLLDHSQNLEITDDILESASWGADAGALRALLARASNPKISTTALSSAVRWGDTEVIQLLLDVGIEPQIITPDVLGQAAYAGNAETLKLLFEQAEKFEITEKTMMDVAQCREGCETVQMLIDRGGRITQDVILSAAWHGTAIVLELLLQHGGRITEQLIEVGVKNVIDGTEVTKLLLQQAERSLIDNDWVEIMKSAADNTWHGPMVVKQLLDVKASCPLPEEVLLAVTQNNISGTKILDTILKDGREMEITSRVIEEAFRALDYHDVLSRLLDRYQSSAITAEMLAAAAGNQRFGDEIVGLLLNRSAVIHEPTDEVLKALVINAHSGYEMLRLMEDKFGQFTFNEALVEAAVAHGSPETVELILDRQPATPITEELLLMSASSGQAEVMKLLLNRSKILATEDTIVAAAGNSQCGRDMTKLLLTQSPHVKVNSAMIQKAAGRYFDAIEILRVLLSRTERIKLSAAVFIDAMRDQYCCEDIVSLLLKANVDVDVTEDVFIEVAKTSNVVALVKLFADHGFKLQASENVVEAILTEGNVPLLELLLEGEGDFQVKINDRMLDSASRNGRKKVLKILSKHKLIDLDNSNWYNIARLRNAALEGKVDQMRELIELGTPADLPDNIGRTPLSWAVAPGKWNVRAGQEEIIELLLAAKADVESRGHNGLTPLCCAAFEGQRRAVKLLLDAGALVQVQDDKGDTPVSLARKQGHLRLAKELEHF